MESAASQVAAPGASLPRQNPFMLGNKPIGRSDMAFEVDYHDLKNHIGKVVGVSDWVEVTQ